MRTRQVLAAALVALAVGYAVTTTGRSTLTAAGIGILAFALTRLALATIGRTRYWLSRGTPGIFSTSCPSCNQYIYRQSGDWILQCHRCGWTAGWPLVRWVTQSVPSRQLRRSVSRGTVAIVLVAALLFAGGVGAVPGMGIDSAGTQPAASSSADTTPTATVTSAAQSTGTEVGTVDLGKAESLVVSMANQRRTERSSQPLERTENLDKIAQYHSNDMAQNDYYSHDSPGGESVRDRFEMFPNSCSAAVSENIHRGEINERMRVWNGDETIYTSEPRGVARYLVKGWMNSEGHRENLLRDEWSKTGVGIAVQPDGDMFATQVFC